jgi:hypothetical protein
MIRSRAAQVRSSVFKEEALGNLGIFYKSTAEGYRTRMLEENKEINKLKEEWEKRFSAAEASLKTNNEGSLRERWWPSFIDPITGQAIPIYKVLNKDNSRMSFEDMLKNDTSKRGNIFFVGQEAKKVLEREYNYGEWETTATNYESKLKLEMEALQKRNEEARLKFLENKKKQLEDLEVGSYRQATYTEKPL